MKDEILRLRAEGYTYNQIVEELGCSKGSVSYHCGEGQKEKNSERTRKRRSNYLRTKYEWFTSFVWSEKKKESILYPERAAYHKARDFQKDLDLIMRVPVDDQFSMKDVYDKYGKDVRCYLTDRKINLEDTNSYEFDHIIPKSRGGASTIDNLGICTRDANRSKADLSLDEYLQLCIDVLVNYGIIEEAID